MKKILTLLLAGAMMVSMAACGGSEKTEETPEAPAEETPAEEAPEAPEGEEALTSDAPAINIAMVTDEGGVNDESFNQSGWEGLEAFQAATGSQVKYLESTQEEDYVTNLGKFSEEDQDLIWGVGFKMADAIKNTAKMNPDKLYAIVDFSYDDPETPEEDTPDNIIGVMFKAQESSFLCGYIAGHMTQTNTVGFVGGVKGNIISQFEYGFKSGVDYAAKELGKEITVLDQYAGNFSDGGLGKSIAQKQIEQGADIVHHAAGGVGIGVIEACKEAGVYAIGVDMDQNSVAPETVITSAMKRVGNAIFKISERVANGEELGGTTVLVTIKDGGTGIAPTSYKLVPEDVLAKAAELEEKVKNDEIVPAYNEATYEEFVAGLK